ncbi:hypothetical protein FG379_000854 [Cryptosporidium bovis]|uniref:uncharacterized protein n=1 Tax=Cryptosporidium bovis TaxID=310047 RepID=UPI003519F88D|nr:hypothetical protein FG379_000854 [Cryptosporidium bovis]
MKIPDDETNKKLSVDSNNLSDSYFKSGHNNSTLAFPPQLHAQSKLNNSNQKIKGTISPQNSVIGNANVELVATTQSQLYMNNRRLNTSIVDSNTSHTHPAYNGYNKTSSSILTGNQSENYHEYQKNTQNSISINNPLITQNADSNLNHSKINRENTNNYMNPSVDKVSSFNLSQDCDNCNNPLYNGVVKEENFQNSDKVPNSVVQSKGSDFSFSPTSSTIHPIISNIGKNSEFQRIVGSKPLGNEDKLTNNVLITSTNNLPTQSNLKLSSRSPSYSSSSNTPILSPSFPSSNIVSSAVMSGNRVAGGDSSKNSGYNSFPVEKIVWDYLHLLHVQNKQGFSYLAQYVDDTFNIGKFHCMVTEFCKREKYSRDALIINAKNWFREYIDRKESESTLAPNITLNEGIRRYLNKKLKYYLDLGFSFEQGTVDLYYNIFIYMIKGIWERLEEASFDRVDWSLRPYLNDDEDQECTDKHNNDNKKQRVDDTMYDNEICVNSNYNSLHDCDLVSHVMRLNEAKDLSFKEKDSNNTNIHGKSSSNKSSQQNENTSSTNEVGKNLSSSKDNKTANNDGILEHDPREKSSDSNGEGIDQVKEMVIVSRKQKWLLRNVKLSDFMYIIQMDDIYDKLLPPLCINDSINNNSLSRRIKLPKNVRRKLSEMICLHYSSVQ